jgi:hypothetical protein
VSGDDIEPAKLPVMEFAKVIRIPDFNITDPGVMTKFKGEYVDVSMRGMSDVTMDSVKFNLEWMHLDAVFKVPSLTINGLYSMSGQLMLIPFSGKGPFSMTLKDVSIYSTTSLNRTTDNKFQVSAQVLELRAARITANFDNLFNRISSPVIADIMRMLSKQLNNLVFDHMKPRLVHELDSGFRAHIDRVLETLPEKFVHERTTAKFDFLIDIIRKEIVRSQHDPLHLDDVKESFDQDLRLFRFNGELALTNRTVYGLSTIFRSGHVLAHYDMKEKAVVLEANLGFENLTSTNNFNAKMINQQGPKGSSDLTANTVTAFLRLRQGLKPGSKAVLEEFHISSIKNIWVQIHGLGSWDGVVETLVNLISNSFKSTIARIISGPVRKVLQDEIDKLHFDYFTDATEFS